ncbi:MAG: alpha/beta hydrolase [Gammaproteobacteria bacterium]|nr:alpha/beta hydrolase [Gammaproteobacteria bacterium]
MLDERWVTFFSEGSRVVGDLFLPTGMQPGERRAGIVLCHGFTGVRELSLRDYAQCFAEAGFVTLIFDYRGFGESEGPKWRLIPLEQVDDIRNALTWLSAQPEVDATRIGLWGTSFGGAHVPYVAGIDPRVRAAVAQVGFDTGETFLIDVRNESERSELQRQIEEDRRLRVLTGRGRDIDPFQRALENPHASGFMAEALRRHPHMRCLLSWETWEKTLEYRPLDVVAKISPRALLLIAAAQDTVCLPAGYRRLYDRAGEPKKLLTWPISHYDIYAGEWFSKSASEAIAWFNTYLKA